MSAGDRTGALYVLAAGSLEVTSQGARVAIVEEPGAVLGEISALLDVGHGATVTARSDAVVHVVDDPQAFLNDPDNAFEVARTLAARLNRLVGYLGDVKAQYAAAGGHLELLDEILGELTFGSQAPVEPGSERDPDPLY